MFSLLKLYMTEDNYRYIVIHILLFADDDFFKKSIIFLNHCIFLACVAFEILRVTRQF